MALNLSNKLARVMQFLMTVREPRIFTQLNTRGFSDAVIEEGWRLFNLAAGAKLAYGRSGSGGLPSNTTAQYLADLDRWENTWFPLVDATLKRHYPQIHAQVFHNLSQTSGNEVVVSVSTLLDRLAEVAQKPEGQQANALLSERGLTDDERAVARTLLDQLRRRETTVLPELDPVTVEEQQQAALEVWAWYMEWSQIARTVITRGDTLVHMGLRRLRRNASGEVEEVEDEEDEGEEPGIVAPVGTAGQDTAQPAVVG